MFINDYLIIGSYAAEAEMPSPLFFDIQML